MLNFNRQSDASKSAESDSWELDAIVRWLRGLSKAELKELREALANHDTRITARFHRRLEASLDRSG